MVCAIGNNPLDVLGIDTDGDDQATIKTEEVDIVLWLVASIEAESLLPFGFFAHDCGLSKLGTLCSWQGSHSQDCIADWLRAVKSLGRRYGEAACFVPSEA